MAIRTAMYGLASVHVFDWVNCRSMGLNFAGVLKRRLAGLLAVGVLAYATMHFGEQGLRAAGAPALVALIAASCIYGLLLLVMLWFAPDLAGLSRGQIVRTLRLTKN